MVAGVAESLASPGSAFLNRSAGMPVKTSSLRRECWLSRTSNVSFAVGMPMRGFPMARSRIVGRASSLAVARRRA